MPPQASEDLYRTLQRLQVAVVATGRRAWSRMRPADFDGSWAAIADPLLAVTASAQLAAARAATAYVPAVLDETDQPNRPAARVKPQAFAGVASDGRALDTLLKGAVRQAKRGVGIGLDGGDALAMGQRWLDMALPTILSDSARDATAAEIAVRPDMAWVRQVNPPCCSRCAVLAGKVYKWNHGFQRHPHCDCVHIPTTVEHSSKLLTDPQELFRRGQITDLSQAQQKRLSEGGDLSKVLNESRDRWRQQMTVQRRAERPVTSATRRASNGLVVPTGWGTAANLPAGGIQDFLTNLTNQADAIRAMKRAGIVD